MLYLPRYLGRGCAAFIKWGAQEYDMFFLLIQGDDLETPPSHILDLGIALLLHADCGQLCHPELRLFATV